MFLQALLEKYFRLLPQYQGVPLSQLKFRRLLFGGFPCYQDSPLQPQFDRILQARRPFQDPSVHGPPLCCTCSSHCQFGHPCLECVLHARLELQNGPPWSHSLTAVAFHPGERGLQLFMA